MHHRAATATAVLLALTACGGQRRLARREGNGAVTGIVSLPAQGMHKGADACEGLQVRVAPPDAPADEALGRVQLKLSRGRCLYVVAHLPSKTALRVTVAPGRHWRCDSGAPPAFVPAEASLQLRDYQTATRDFSVRCPSAP